VDQNVLLVLMRLDLNDQANPLRAGAGSRGDEMQLLERGKPYWLLAGVLDPRQRSTSVPLTGIPLNDSKLDTYNAILEGFQEISQLFYGDSGFINEPQAYSREKQNKVFGLMANVGKLIFELFPEKNPVRVWLAELLRSEGRPVPVTIITNDFGIPWFWLKREQYGGRFLCEASSLGLLQLSAVGRPGESANPQCAREDKTYEALLVKGSSEFPFVEEDLKSIEALLETPRRSERFFKVQQASTAEKIRDIISGYSWADRLDDCCIVHFSGHFSGKHLFLDGVQLPDESLFQVLNGSLLVLDGSSNAQGLQAWADVEELSSTLINKGALGCVASVLPVKHDPIVSKILWETFYSHLRRGRTTVGQALVEARLALKKHFVSLDSNNPMWLFYQLIGSAAIQLCEEEETRDV
jgi:hypothetical protein